MNQQHLIGQICSPFIDSRGQQSICVAITPADGKIHTVVSHCPRQVDPDQSIWNSYDSYKDLVWYGQGPNDFQRPTTEKFHCECTEADVWYCLETPWNMKLLAVYAKGSCTNVGHGLLGFSLNNEDEPPQMLYLPYWFLGNSPSIRLDGMSIHRRLAPVMSNAMHYLLRCVFLPGGSMVLRNEETKMIERWVVIYAPHVGRHWHPNQLSVMEESPWFGILQHIFGPELVRDRWMKDMPLSGRSWGLWIVKRDWLEGVHRKDNGGYNTVAMCVHQPTQKVCFTACPPPLSPTQSSKEPIGGTLSPLDIIRTYSDRGSVFLRDDLSTIPPNTEWIMPSASRPLLSTGMEEGSWESTTLTLTERNTCFLLPREYAQHSTILKSQRVLIGVCDMYVPQWNAVRVWICDMEHLVNHILAEQSPPDLITPPLYALQQLAVGCFLLPCSSQVFNNHFLRFCNISSCMAAIDSCQ